MVIGRVGENCGNTYLEVGKCWVSDNAIWSKSKISSEEFCNYLLLDYLSVNQYVIGTGQPLLTQEILRKISILTISEENVQFIDHATKPLFQKQCLNKKEILNLQSLQSLFLSRLSTE